MTANGTNQVDRVGVTQFGYLGIGASDLDEWQDFAEKVLGIQANGRSAAGDLLLRMDGNHHRFIVKQDAVDDLIFQGWEVKDTAALAAMKAQVSAFGLDVRDGTAEEKAERMVRGLIKFNDPEGNPTEIYYGPLIDHVPFVSPRGINRFIADELGFGHIVIAVDDDVAYTRYLTEVLGARLSDHIAIPIGPMTLNITFFHVNARHHSIAIAKRSEHPFPPRKLLQHMMIEADTIDAVGLAHGLFMKRGLNTGTLGRHTNDHMFSFYAETPSGFHIEYGYGGSTIDDEDKWVVQTYNSPSVWGHSMPRPAGMPAGGPPPGEGPPA